MTTLRGERAATGRGLWRQWVVASSLGFGVGLAGFSLVEETLGHPEDGGVAALLAGALGPTAVNILGHSLGFALLGAALGVAQALVLRGQRAGAPRWAWASLAGFAATIPLFRLIFALFGYPSANPLPKPLDLFLALGIAQTLAGLLQWRILGAAQAARAGWWVLITPISFVVSVILGFALVEGAMALTGVGLPEVVILGLGGSVIGAVFGAGTGALLIRLFRQPVPAAGIAAPAPGARQASEA